MTARPSCTNTSVGGRWRRYQIPDSSARLVMVVASGGNGARRTDRDDCRVFNYGALAASFCDVTANQKLYFAVGMGGTNGKWSSTGVKYTKYPGGGLSAVCKTPFWEPVVSGDSDYVNYLTIQYRKKFESTDDLYGNLVALAAGGGGTAERTDTDLCLKCYGSNCSRLSGSAGKDADGSGHGGCGRYLESSWECGTDVAGKGATITSAGESGQGNWPMIGGDGRFLQGGFAKTGTENRMSNGGGGGGGLYGGGGGNLSYNCTSSDGFMGIGETTSCTNRYGSGGAGSSWIPFVKTKEDGSVDYTSNPDKWVGFLTCNDDDQLPDSLRDSPFVKMRWAKLTYVWNASTSTLTLTWASDLRLQEENYVWKKLFKEDSMRLVQNSVTPITVQNEEGSMSVNVSNLDMNTFDLILKDVNDEDRVIASVMFRPPPRVFEPQVACSDQDLSIFNTNALTWTKSADFPTEVTFAHATDSDVWRFTNASDSALLVSLRGSDQSELSVLVSPGVFLLSDVNVISGESTTVSLLDDDTWSLDASSSLNAIHMKNYGMGSISVSTLLSTTSETVVVNVTRQTTWTNGSATRSCTQTTQFRITAGPFVLQAIACAGQELSILGTENLDWEPVTPYSSSLTWIHNPANDKWIFNNTKRTSDNITFVVSGQEARLSILVSAATSIALQDIAVNGGDVVSVSFSDDSVWTRVLSSNISEINLADTGPGPIEFIAPYLPDQGTIAFRSTRIYPLTLNSITKECSEVITLNVLVNPFVLPELPTNNLQTGELAGIQLDIVGLVPTDLVTWSLNPESDDIGLQQRGSGISIPADPEKTPAFGTAIYNMRLERPDGTVVTWEFRTTYIPGDGDEIDYVVCSGTPIYISGMDSWLLVSSSNPDHLGLTTTSGTDTLSFVSNNTTFISAEMTIRCTYADHVLDVNVLVFPQHSFTPPPAHVAVCSGSIMPRIDFHMSEYYSVSWSQTMPTDEPFSGLPQSGNDFIPEWTATNQGSEPIIVSFAFVVTPNEGVPCAGETYECQVRISPEPIVAQLDDIVVCAGDTPVNVTLRTLFLNTPIEPTSVNWSLTHEDASLNASGIVVTESDGQTTWADVVLAFQNPTPGIQYFTIHSSIENQADHCLVFKQFRYVIVLPIPKLDAPPPDEVAVCPGETIVVGFGTFSFNTQVHWTLGQLNGTGDFSLETDNDAGNLTQTLDYKAVTTWTSDEHGTLTCESEKKSVVLRVHARPPVLASEPVTLSFCGTTTVPWLNVSDPSEFEWVWTSEGPNVGETLTGSGPSIGSVSWTNPGQETVSTVFSVQQRSLSTGCLSESTLVTVQVFPVAEIALSCTEWTVVAGQTFVAPVTTNAPFVILSIDSPMNEWLTDRVYTNGTLTMQAAPHAAACTRVPITLQPTYSGSNETMCSDNPRVQTFVTIVPAPSLNPVANLVLHEQQSVSVPLTLQAWTCVRMPAARFTWIGGSSVGLADNLSPRETDRLAWSAPCNPSGVEASIQITPYIPKQWGANGELSESWVAGTSFVLHVRANPLPSDVDRQVPVTLLAGSSYTYELPFDLVSATFTSTSVLGSASVGILDASTGRKMTIQVPTSLATIETWVVRIQNTCGQLVATLNVTAIPLPTVQATTGNRRRNVSVNETLELTFESSPGSTIRWTNSNPDIGLDTSGQGNISFVVPPNIFGQRAVITYWSEVQIADTVVRSESKRIQVISESFIQTFVRPLLRCQFLD